VLGVAIAQTPNTAVKNLHTFTVHNAAENFTEVKNLLKVTGSSTQAQAKREGQIFVVRVLAENTSEFTNVTAFEYTGLAGCEPDVVINSGTNAIYCEFKSWSDYSPKDDTDDKEENTGSSGGGAFYFFKLGRTSSGKENNSYKQFKALLRGIGSMNQVRYYFDGKKISGSQANKEKFVKEVFQALFQNQTNEIFDVIWGNVRLRGDLFPETVGLNENDLKNIKPSILLKFQNSIANTSNSFYDFIKVK
jgi:hypothetical protein